MNRNLVRSLPLLVLAFSAVSAQASLIHIEGKIDSSNVVTSTTLEQSDYFPFSFGFGYSFSIGSGGEINTSSFFASMDSYFQVDTFGQQTDSSVPGLRTYSGGYVITKSVKFGIPTYSFGTYSGYYDQNNKTFMLDLSNPTTTPAPAAAIPFALGLLRRRRRQA